MPKEWEFCFTHICKIHVFVVQQTLGSEATQSLEQMDWTNMENLDFG